MVGGEIVSVRSHDETRHVADTAAEHAHQVDRRPVRPVQVLQHQHRRFGRQQPFEFPEHFSGLGAALHEAGHRSASTITGAIVAAFRAHQIDTYVGGTTTFLGMEENGVGRLLFPVTAYEGSVASGAIFASNELIAANPEAIRAFLSGWLETTDFIRTHKAEAVPLMAALLSVPLVERYPPLHWSPQQQKQKTQETLVAWLVAEAERQPVLAVWEDLHWADPSTLEWLGLVLDQTPTAPLCILLTYRP